MINGPDDCKIDPRIQEIDRLAHRLLQLDPFERSRLNAIMDRMREAQQTTTTVGRGAETNQSFGGGGEIPVAGGLRGVTLGNVDEAFHYQPSLQTEQGQTVVDTLVFAAKAILRNVPDCPDRSAALRKVREASMDAHSAIAHYGQF